MRIYQVIPTLAYGDAVGNDTVALKQLISSLGYKTDIFAESIVSPYNEKTAKKISQMPVLDTNDIIIYHLSTGTKLNYTIADYKCRKIVIYHNVTPPQYFSSYSPFFYGINTKALEGAKYLADKVDYCLADSEFNKQDLIDMGYKCPIDVLPILIPFDDYLKKPNTGVLKRYSDTRTNILSTGRIVPNKKIENVIKAFYMYKKYYDKEARLFLVGSYTESDLYYRKLKKYVSDLDLKDVIFTGHIKFDEILAYYTLADVYLCMSEHEGFCVPLAESMFFDIPIIAYDKCAIKYTLGGSGILLENNNPLEVAGVINRVISDNNLRETIKKGQRLRLCDFRHDAVAEQFKKYLEKFISGETK